MGKTTSPHSKTRSQFRLQAVFAGSGLKQEIEAEALRRTETPAIRKSPVSMFPKPEKLLSASFPCTVRRNLALRQHII
ncbi:MAG: hypothetical protein B6245_12645 [Desulfobacteraceae bacterium 4572_88]|nr:MAG: hypothetical protein B6245_12645 [Desulfobacteraceae bacterium 4572_88]